MLLIVLRTEIVEYELLENFVASIIEEFAAHGGDTEEFATHGGAPNQPVKYGTDRFMHKLAGSLLNRPVRSG